MAKLAIKGGKSVRSKPFSEWPVFGDEELVRVTEVLRSGNWSYHSRGHEKQKEFAERFAGFQDCKYGVCASSGAAALQVSLMAAGVRPGDEVVVPALTFAATASAALLIGAVPVFVDVDPDTYCIDVGRVREALTDRTKAVMPVHLYCRIADMDSVMKLANENGLVVVEDCCQTHGSKWRGKGVGAFGNAGCFSFQQSKTITAGEGGMIVTNDRRLEEICASLVDCGRVRKGDKFAENDLGWNYRLTEFQAAVLLAQLERLPDQMQKREENAKYLYEKLRRIDGIEPLKKDERVTRQSYYFYVLKYDPYCFEGVHRDRFMAALSFEGVPCEQIYEPVYRCPLFKIDPDKLPLGWGSRDVHVDYSAFKCPVAEKASYEEAVAIPHKVLLGGKEDMDDVVAAIEKVKDNAKELHKADSKLLKIFRAFRRHTAHVVRHPRRMGDLIDELKS